MNDGFFQYINLSPEDALLAEQAQLLLVLSDAHKVIFKTKVTDTHSRYQVSKNLTHTSEEIEKLQHVINYVLELIGKYSNERFGDTALLQVRWFQRKYEHGAFFVHLFGSIQTHKGRQMPPVEVDGEIINEADSGDYPAKLKNYEDREKAYFINGDEFYTEKQLYAAAVYYMVPFLLDALKTNDAMHVSKLWSSIAHFRDGVEHATFLSQLGGQKSGKARSKNKDRAYDIFVKHGLNERSPEYPDRKPKNYIMAEELEKLLPEDIEVSLNTIKTDWIPEFVKRSNNEKMGEGGSSN